MRESTDPKAYWIEQMEAAYGFMERLLEYPVQECGEGLRRLDERAREAGVRIAFASGKKIGMFDRVFCVRQSLVDKLLRAAEAFLKRGYVLRIEDVYRSPRTQTLGARSSYVIRSVLDRVLWELDGRIPTAELVFRRLAVWTATTLKFANHTSGSALDVTALRRDGSVVDLGGTYPQLSHLTPMASPFVAPAVRRNREMICALLAEEGFVPYPFEFWHFSCGDADCEMMAGTGRPGRFGPVHFSDGGGPPTPATDILEPFVGVEDVVPYLDALRESRGTVGQ